MCDICVTRARACHTNVAYPPFRSPPLSGVRLGERGGGPKLAVNSTRRQEMIIISTVVAKIITELSCFEPEICICDENFLEFKGESVSVMRDSLQTFPQICFCNEINSSGSTVRLYCN